MTSTERNKQHKCLQSNVDVYKQFSDAACKGDVETVTTMLAEGTFHVDGVGTLTNAEKPALYLASKAGHLSIVQALIAAGADVNMTHSFQGIGTTALHVACRDGRSLEVVQELLNAGAKVDLGGESALQVLLLWGDRMSEHMVSIARLLLEAKCNVTANALFLVCGKDIPHEILTLMVASGADLAIRSTSGMTALHECITRESSAEKIKCLLKNGIDVNAKDKYGKTALHRAVAMDTKVIPLLLHYNANIFLRTKRNTTVLMEVLRQSHTSCEDLIMIIRLMLAKMNPCDKLFLDHQNDDGWTALHFAAEKGSEKVIHELLNWKPDITRKTDDRGYTALHIFVKNANKYEDNSLDALRCLVEHENGYGTHAINLLDYNGRTALHLALETTDCASMLQYLSRVANVSITDRRGETSLHFAVRNNRSKGVILALLGSRYGAEAARIPNCQGMTALQMAIFWYKDDREIVHALSQMTNVDARDRYGQTALHYAVQSRRLDFLNILLYERKADPSIQDCEGNTPLSLACDLHAENACCIQDDSLQLSLILQLYQYGVAYGANML